MDLGLPCGGQRHLTQLKMPIENGRWLSLPGRGVGSLPNSLEGEWTWTKVSRAGD